MKILVLCFWSFFSLSCSKEDSIVKPKAPDIAGKWQGLASDDGQLGTAGLSVFTFELSQNETSISGPVRVQKAAYSDTYYGTISGNLELKNSLWEFNGSFDIIINDCQVHIAFSAVRDVLQLVGYYGGTNSCLGNITGGTFVLDKK